MPRFVRILYGNGQGGCRSKVGLKIVYPRHGYLTNNKPLPVSYVRLAPLRTPEIRRR